MACNEYTDNRESCGNVLSSSCVPYTGYISDTIKDDFKCKPNINDVFKRIQELLDEIKESLGDNTKLKLLCLEGQINEEFSQKDLNQQLINKICELEGLISNNNEINPELIKITINLLCLQDPSCDPKEQYSIVELFQKLIVAHCNLLGRVQAIENILNI